MADPVKDLSETLFLGEGVALTLEPNFFTISNDLGGQKPSGMSLYACLFGNTKREPALKQDSPDTGERNRFFGSGLNVQDTIDYLHVLWAQVADCYLTINYVQRKGRSNGYQLKLLKFSLGATDPEATETWVNRLLDLCYRGAKRQKRVKVLVNPHAGPGKGLKLYHQVIEPIFRAARCKIEMEVTQRRGHADEMMNNLDTAAWDVVACCSGDGLPHEVYNGLAKRPDAKHALASIAVIQLPCGSGNGMCCSTLGTINLSLAALYIVKGIEQSLDLVSVTQGQNRMLSFLSQTGGTLAECDLETEHLRFLGRYRFMIGVFQRIIWQPRYPCDIAFCEYDITSEDMDIDKPCDNVEDIGIDSARNCDGRLPPLRFGTVNDPIPTGWEISRHEALSVIFAGQLKYMDAGTKLFPHAQMDDGLVDVLIVEADLPRVKLLQLFANTGDGRYVNMGDVNYRKAVAYRFTPRRKNGCISIDGERVPFEAFQVEVHKGLGLTLRRPENAVPDLP